MYKFESAVLPTCILLHTLSKRAHKSNPAESRPIFASEVITSYSSNRITLLLLCISAPLVLRCDQFDRGSRQVKRDLVDLVTEDYDITLRWRICTCAKEIYRHASTTIMRWYWHHCQLALSTHSRGLGLRAHLSPFKACSQKSVLYYLVKFSDGTFLFDRKFTAFCINLYKN